MGDYGVDILVRVSVLTKGPLLERRKEIRRSLVLATLSTYELGSEFEVIYLSRDIKNITKCELGNEDVTSILHGLETEATVQHIGELKYKLKKKLELPEFSQQTQPVWEEFLPFLEKQFTDYDRYIDKDVRKIFDSALLKLLTRFEISSKFLENQIESLPIEDFKSIIEEDAKKSSLSKKLSKKYAGIIYSFFGLNPPNLLQFIFDSYSKLINIDLVRREQEMPLIDFLENIKFLLVDTSFLTALMCKTDPAHPLASAVTKQCVKSNIPLYYALKTKQEMWRFINGSKHEMNGLSTSNRHKLIQSQFVSDFRRQNISWNDYITTLNMWEQSVEKQWQIILSPEDFSENIDEDIYQYTKTALTILDNVRYEDRVRKYPDYPPRLKGDAQLDHDAFCLGAIAYSRKTLEENDGKKPIGPWFLTFDNLLSTLNAIHFRKEDDFGFVIQPRTLLNYLLIYSKIEFEKEDTEDVAEAIIKFTARAPDPKLTFDEYTRQVTYKIGLDETDIEVVKEIFLKSPLREELDRAIELDRGDEADSVVYEIITSDEFVETVVRERKTKEKLKNVAQELRKTKEELSKKEVALKTLEGVVGQQASVTTNVIINLDVNIQNKVNNLVSLLKSENAFEDGLLEKPPEVSTKEKLKNWLKTSKETIETSKTVSEGIKSLLPFIIYLITKLG